MRLAPLLALVLLCGCQIGKFNKPPAWASAIVSHERFYGLNASIPYSGSAILKVQLGWGSSTWTVIPASTNTVFIPKLSDTFSIGTSLNPFDTVIREYLQTQWEGATPPPATMIFKPKL